MKKIILITAAIILASLVAVALMPRQPQTTAPSPAPLPQSSQPQVDTEKVNKQEAIVTIRNFAYEPSSITVKKGTNVIWTNQDTVRHDVASDDGAPAGGPKGPLLGKGESYSHTFDTVGVFTYHCSPHTHMKATVIVTE